jgi:hypothetical protein
MLEDLGQEKRKVSFLEMLYPAFFALFGFRIASGLGYDSFIVAASGAAVGALLGSVAYRVVANRSVAVKIAGLVVLFFGTLWLMISLR